MKRAKNKKISVLNQSVWKTNQKKQSLALPVQFCACFSRRDQKEFVFSSLCKNECIARSFQHFHFELTVRMP